MCIYGLGMDWLLAISWLLTIYRQAISWLWPKINTFEDIVIYCVPKLHMAASNALHCSVFTRFLAIGWLSAGYGPKSKPFKTVIYNYITKLHMLASNTLDCSVVMRYLAIGWLLASYSPKSIHFKT